MGWKEWRQQRQLSRDLAVVSGHANRTMWLLVPFVPVLLLVVYVQGLSRKGASDFNMVFWEVIATLIAGVFVFFEVEKHRARRFLRWLRKNREALQVGGVPFHGQELGTQSEVVQYEICVSMFILYAQFRTSYCVKGRDLGMRLLSTVIVLLFGWWSLWGPFVTIKNLVVNLRGGHRVRVEDLLQSLPA